MYDIEKSELDSFIEKEVAPDCYKVKEILGELYFTTTKKLRRITMAYVLQVDFKMDGPFGNEMAEVFCLANT